MKKAMRNSSSDPSPLLPDYMNTQQKQMLIVSMHSHSITISEHCSKSSIAGPNKGNLVIA